jgi:hypothetical protein
LVQYGAVFFLCPFFLSSLCHVSMVCVWSHFNDPSENSGAADRSRHHDVLAPCTRNAHECTSRTFCWKEPQDPQAVLACSKRQVEWYLQFQPQVISVPSPPRKLSTCGCFNLTWVPFGRFVVTFIIRGGGRGGVRLACFFVCACVCMCVCVCVCDRGHERVSHF